MRFTKFVLCLIIGVLIFNVSYTKAFATEDTSVKQEQEILTENISKDNISKDNIESNQDDKEKKNKYTKADLRLLTAIIYCEAQGESYNGKLAVGIVVMNRVESDRYPNTIKKVIYQKYQFSPVTNGTLEKVLDQYDKGNFTSSSEKECIKAAKATLNGTKSITVSGNKKSFGKYLSFSGRLKGYTYKLGNHKFK